MKYIVIENTPGYMPEDDDPLITDDYQQAAAYLNERCAEYEADGYQVEYGLASSANYAAAAIHDPTKSHDLGRYIAIEHCEDES